MEATNLDPPTARLAVELYLSDIDKFLEDDPANDAQRGDERVALVLRKEELQRQLITFVGQHRAYYMIVEEQATRIAFNNQLQREKTAVKDHQLALKLAGKADTDPEMRASQAYEQSLSKIADLDHDEQWMRTQQWYLPTQVGKPTPGRNTASQAQTIPGAVVPPSNEQSNKRKATSDIDNEQSKKLKTADLPTNVPSNKRKASIILENEQSKKAKTALPSSLRKCNVCMEAVSVENTLTLVSKPEPHTYCHPCLTQLVKAAMQDNTLFPPRCCKVPIPVGTCQAALPKALVKDFDLKLEKKATPNPTYCSSCAKFIRTQDIHSDVGTCPFCKTKTCTTCKAQEHIGLCPVDPHVKLLMDAAERSKWQQCGQCKTMVELSVGCFHMM